MFRNYLKIAVRNLLRNRIFSVINICGLAIGMASALLILLWVQNELSMDRIYPKTDRTYLLCNRDKLFNGEMWAWDQTPKVLASVLKKDFSGVEDAVRFTSTSNLTSVGSKNLNSQGAFADSGFLSVFGFPLLHGDPAHSLAGPYNIVLTQSLAQRLFGKADPMGQTVRIDNDDNYTVTGVLRDLPTTTSFQFDYLLPWSFITRMGWDDQYWGNNSIYTYVLLKPAVTQGAFDKQVRNVTTRHSKETAEVFTQPMSRLHLYAKSENGLMVAGKVITVRLFSVIAAFILLIACINFMNMSTARSEKRAREVGIRKVVGAYRGSLIAQFIGESILLSGLAFIIALFLIQICLPAFNQLVGKQLAVPYDDMKFWLFALGFILFTGLLAGSYPAFYLSSFRPVSVLKGTFNRADALITPRKILVVLQFSFAIMLVICTLIIRRQIQYGLDRDAGYNRDHLVYAPTPGSAYDHYDGIKRDLLNSGAATAVTRSPAPITRHWSDSYGYTWKGSTKEDERKDFLGYAAQDDFTTTMGITLLQGRDIDINKYPTDSTALLLNESAVKAMHLDNPVGQIVAKQGEGTYHVVGVIKNFILESPFTSQVAPMMIAGPYHVYCEGLHFRLNPANSTAANLALAEKIFHRYNPSYPFEYSFTDEAYAKKFRDEQQIGKLSALFAGLTIFISCLGLFALAAYMAENRTKEIGVRKVLGASVTSITTLLTKDFIQLVMIAFLVAAPLAWVVMNKWLLTYSYRISIGWDIFALSGMLALLIAAATVSYQSIRAALANPVDSLRSQ